jgi:hypothetical protein
MRLTSAILAMAAVIWWSVFVSKGADDWWYLVAALGLTLAWFASVMAHANRRINRIVRHQDQSRDPR